MRIAAALILLAAAVSAPAQTPMQTPPGSPDPARAVAGNYKIEPNTTQVMFALDRLGFSLFRGFLSQASGTLAFDPKNPAANQLSVTIPIASILTTSADLNRTLLGPDWFDAGQFPTATFVSTQVTPGQKPQDWALVEGNLTIHGQTHPAEMRVHFHGAGMTNRINEIGFDGRLPISRSEYGLGRYVPLLSDHVEITIAAAFQQV